MELLIKLQVTRSAQKYVIFYTKLYKRVQNGYKNMEDIYELQDN